MAINPTILRLLKELSKEPTEEDLLELTRLLILAGYYAPNGAVSKKQNRSLLLKRASISWEERDHLLKNPRYAFSLAQDVDKEPRNDTRICASKSANFAFRYALEIDKEPTEETRRGACQSPEYAYKYACQVDKKPGEETREGACRDPDWALSYARFEKKVHPLTKRYICNFAPEAFAFAKEIQKTPCSETRTGACQNPKYAFKYALEVDEKAFPETRIAACKDPSYGYDYAISIDKKAKKSTRNSASRNPRLAFLYAVFLDGKKFHPVTWKGVQNSSFEKRYQEEIAKGKRGSS